MGSDNEYMRVYMAERYERRMAEAQRALGGRCVKCGTQETLEFDHIDPATKKFSIGRSIAGCSEKRLQEELAKCQLLCVSCHQEKSRQEGSLGKLRADYRANPKHGTSTMYVRWKCRCWQCRLWRKWYYSPRSPNQDMAARS